MRFRRRGEVLGGKVSVGPAGKKRVGDSGRRAVATEEKERDKQRGIIALKPNSASTKLGNSSIAKPSCSTESIAEGVELCQNSKQASRVSSKKLGKGNRFLDFATDKQSQIIPPSCTSADTETADTETADSRQLPNGNPRVSPSLIIEHSRQVSVKPDKSATTQSSSRKQLTATKEGTQAFGLLRLYKLSAEVRNGDLPGCEELNLDSRGIWSAADTEQNAFSTEQKNLRLVGEKTEEDDFRSLTALRRLDINDNHLRSLRIVRHNSELRWLSVQKNEIPQICHLGSLRELRVLNLANNQISEIENLQSCVELRTLVLSNNRIRRIENLGTLSNLNTLILSHNHISAFSPSPPVYANLKKLSLAHNELTDFPFGSRFPQLEELRVNSNFLTSVSTDVSFMGGLKILDVGNNRIQDVRTTMDRLSQCRKVTNLNMLGNIGLASAAGEADMTALAREKLPNLRVWNSKPLQAGDAKKRRRTRSGHKAGSEAESKTKDQRKASRRLQQTITNSLAERGRDKRKHKLFE